MDEYFWYYDAIQDDDDLDDDDLDYDIDNKKIYSIKNIDDISKESILKIYEH